MLSGSLCMTHFVVSIVLQSPNVFKVNLLSNINSEKRFFFSFSLVNVFFV